MRRLSIILLILLGMVVPVFAQQTTVNRIDVFTGFSYLSTPSINLNQRGFNGSFGVNVNRWLGLGADFGALTGTTNIVVRKTKVPGLLPPAIVPLANNIGVPADATTYTFAAGPQINYRHFQKITLFARPGLGVFHHIADLNLAPLAPLLRIGVTIPGLTSHMTDTVPFYGVGGGFDAEVSKHFGFRFSADLVHANPFDNVLKPQNELRLSIGPRFKFGQINSVK